METKRPKRRKAPNKNVIEEDEEDSYKENEPARLMEEVSYFVQSNIIIFNFSSKKPKTLSYALKGINLIDML
jgi:hypothetical protein